MKVEYLYCRQAGSRLTIPHKDHKGNISLHIVECPYCPLPTAYFLLPTTYYPKDSLPQFSKGDFHRRPAPFT